MRTSIIVRWCGVGVGGRRWRWRWQSAVAMEVARWRYCKTASEPQVVHTRGEGRSTAAMAGRQCISAVSPSR
jgi:hypothetical protein